MRRLMPRVRVGWFVSLLFLSLLAGCGGGGGGGGYTPPTPPPPPDYGTVNPAPVELIRGVAFGTGTTLRCEIASSPFFGMEIQFPAGALAEDRLISLSVNSGADVPGATTPLSMKLEPEGLQFSQPVTIRMPVDAGSLDGTEILSAATWSPSNPLVNWGSVITRLDPLSTISWDQTADEAVAVVEHFSWLNVVFTDRLYAVLELPGELMQKGDLLYHMTENQIWWPGHAAVYTGNLEVDQLGVNDGDAIIESVPTSGVRKGSLNLFRSMMGGRLCLGARTRGQGLVRDDRILVGEYAIERIGDGYNPINLENRYEGGSTYTDVGLCEAAYENADITLTPCTADGSSSGSACSVPLYAVTQFMNTQPVDTVVWVVGEALPAIPVRGVSWDDLGATYVDNDFTATCTIPPGADGATFSGNTLLWPSPVEGEWDFLFQVNSTGIAPVFQNLRISVRELEEDFAQSSYDSGHYVNQTTSHWQEFFPSFRNMNRVDIYILWSEDLKDEVTMEILAPDDHVLGSSTVDLSDLTIPDPGSSVTFEFDPPVALSPGLKHRIRLSSTEFTPGTEDDDIYWGGSIEDGDYRGDCISSGQLPANPFWPDYQFTFELYGTK